MKNTNHINAASSSVFFNQFTLHLCGFRCGKLEKEVATLKEKIHHLDDMLKSQQRKVRHMIEQVRIYNSKSTSSAHMRTHTHIMHLNS